MNRGVTLVRAPKFFVGDPVRIKNRPPSMSNHLGLIRRVFRPTPKGVWRYLLYHRGRKISRGWAKSFVQAYDETELELPSELR